MLRNPVVVLRRSMGFPSASSSVVSVYRVGEAGLHRPGDFTVTAVLAPLAVANVNGQRAGGHPYGYSSFFCDITPYLKPGRNTIAVKADNSRQRGRRG